MTPAGHLDEVAAHLEEYKALRSEINQTTERIDRTIGLYITATFVVVAFLLRPDATFSVQAWLDSLSRDYRLAAFLLAVPVLNALLLVRQVSLYLHILALAQYGLYEIRPRASHLVNAPVLGWDLRSGSSIKRTALRARALQQILFFAVALSISFAVFWVVRPTHAELRGFGTVLYVVAVLSTILALSVIVRAWRVSSTFHRPESEVDQPGANETRLVEEEAAGDFTQDDGEKTSAPTSQN